MSNGLNQLNVHDVKSIKQEYTEFEENKFFTSKLKITDVEGNKTVIVLFADHVEDLKIQT